MLKIYGALLETPSQINKYSTEKEPFLNTGKESKNKRI